MRTEDAFVATTIRFYYDVTIAVALATVFALVVALITAVIVGGNGPNAWVAFVVFLLTATILLYRWRRS
jgi:membrane protein implicated in regulation of membrane protease activity